MEALLLAWVVLTAGITALGLWHLRHSDRARMQRRLKGLAAAFAARSAGADGQADSVLRRRLIQGKLRELELQRQRARGPTLGRLVLQSGLPVTLRGFLLASAAAGGIAGGLTFLLGLAPLMCLLAVLAGGLVLPRLVLRIAIRRRQAQFVHHFADALDIMVRGVRSGLPVGECLRIVANDLPAPIGPEFQLLTEGQQLGMTLKQALDRSIERMPVTEFQFFAVVLAIQQQTGGNLAATLDNLSKVLRARKRLRDKVAALSSEAKASAGIIGALPFLVTGALAVMGPDYIGLLFTERLGNIIVVVGLLWMAMGIAIMRKMINFDF